MICIFKGHLDTQIQPLKPRTRGRKISIDPTPTNGVKTQPGGHNVTASKESSTSQRPRYTGERCGQNVSERPASSPPSPA